MSDSKLVNLPIKAILNGSEELYINDTEDNSDKRISVDQIRNGQIKTVASLSALKALAPAAEEWIYVQGRASVADGFEGFFRNDALDTTTLEDSGIVFTHMGVGRWKRAFTETVNVMWFGAIGDGLTSDHSAIQLALNFASAAGNEKGGIYIPAGKYLLAQPVEVPSHMSIEGQGGYDYGAKQGTVLLPTTVAFKPRASEETQNLVGFICKNIIFKGGTIPIDMGLRAECIFRDLLFFNPTKAAISIVRGERHEFTNIKVYAQTVVCEYGFAFASKTITEMPAVTNNVNYGSEGPWIDRISMDKVVFLYGTGGYVEEWDLL